MKVSRLLVLAPVAGLLGLLGFRQAPVACDPDNAGATLEHHSPDIRHARAVLEQDTHVRVAFDVGDFARPVTHAHDDVAAEAEVPQGNRVRETVLVDGAQYRPAWATIEIRLNFFVTEFSRHPKRLTRFCTSQASPICRRECPRGQAASR